MSIQFGTGGWRAVIGDVFTKANVQLLTAALARKMREEGAAQRGSSSAMTGGSSPRSPPTGPPRSWRGRACPVWWWSGKPPRP